jgi:SAM-dependent methyltransferase
MQHPSPFADPAYRSAFERFRQMPASVFDQYFDLMCVPNQPCGTVLDVGTGPGLQTALLLSRLPEDWRVVGMEPSAELRKAAQARLTPYGPRATIIQCDSLDCLRDEFSGVWLSEVVHLLGSPGRWVAELTRLTRPGGRVLVRTSTHDQLFARRWYRYFPRALKIDLDRHPTRHEVVNAFYKHGFVDIQVDSVDESRVLPATFVREMFRNRAFSTLYYLTAAELTAGISDWTQAVLDRANYLWHYEMTAYTATRAPNGKVQL